MKKNCSPEELTILCTLVAAEISKDRDIDEICKIKNALSQIVCSLSTIITERIANKKH